MCILHHNAEVTVGFAASSYTTSEAVAVVEVCVTLLSGQLGTDITLQLDTHNGTAEGTCTCMYIHMYMHMYMYEYSFFTTCTFVA